LVVRWFSRDLVEHLVETHVDDWVSFDEILEIFDDRKKRKLALGNFLDLLRNPGL